MTRYVLDYTVPPHLIDWAREAWRRWRPPPPPPLKHEQLTLFGRDK